MRKIAVLTSGGDAPGMNACVYNLFVLCNRSNIELFGVKKGYQGLINDDISLLTHKDVENIYALGGSVLKSARSEEFRTKEGKDKAFANLKKYGIEAVVVIGGNGSFRGAQELSREYDIDVFALPGTIDNDLNYTQKSLGFDTAVNNSVSAIDKIKDTPTTVLLEGLSGTGKELIARAIHYRSDKRNKKFVAQYCGALPETLLEKRSFRNCRWRDILPR